MLLAMRRAPVAAVSPIILRIDGNKSAPSDFSTNVAAYSLGDLAMSGSAQYRGYLIEMRTIDDHWMVSVFPTRGDLPALKSVPFHQFPRPQMEVLAEAHSKQA